MFEHIYCNTRLLYLLLKKYIDLSDPARQRGISLQNFAQLRYLPTFFSYAQLIEKALTFFNHIAYQLQERSQTDGTLIF